MFLFYLPYIIRLSVPGRIQIGCQCGISEEFGRKTGGLYCPGSGDRFGSQVQETGKTREKGRGAIEHG